MNYKRLKYFLVLNETESIRKTAEVLSISPAAVSKAIHELEEELNCSLTVSSGRGILITESGKNLAKLAEPIVENLENIKREFKNKDDVDAQKPIRIGSFEVFTTYFLNRLTKLLPTHPLCLYEFLPGELESKLLDYTIDYGITYIPIPTAGISHYPIGLVEMQVFGLKQYFTDLPFNTIPFVIPLQTLSTMPNKVKGLDGWPEEESERLIQFKVTLMESALALCRQGRAVAYLPSFIVKLHNQMVKKKYQLAPIATPSHVKLEKQAVYLVIRKNEPSNEIFHLIKRSLKGVVF